MKVHFQTRDELEKAIKRYLIQGVDFAVDMGNLTVTVYNVGDFDEDG